MQKNLITKEFEKIVKNKFNVYNSLFLNLPYPNVSNIGILIPLLHQTAQKGLEEGKEPKEILDLFFANHTNVQSEEEKIDFMFRVIQYVERQVVLYDSVEDSEFKELVSLQNNLSLNDYIHLSETRKDGHKIIEKLSEFSIRIVFTAHPTQFYPASVLDIIAKLRNFVKQNSINNVDKTLQQLGLTSLMNTQKPTPFEEAKNVIYFLRNVYYESASELYSQIKRNIPNKNFDNAELMQFGFWPGGDRDGNPFVTYKTTIAVADELRMELMKCYYNDLKTLKEKLTFRGVDNIISNLIEKIYPSMFNAEKPISYENILSPLSEIKKLLKDNYNSLYLDEVDLLVDKVKIFKTHFASLDIRQHHKIHKQAVEQILKHENLINESLDEISEEKLFSILLNDNFEIPTNIFDDDIVRDTVITITKMKEIQSKNGEVGCHRYVISNSEDIYSVLFVYALLRWFAWKNENIQMDIIPLFESIEGMKNAEQIMNKLFELSEYKNHVQQRKNIQTIMLGFSDGTKDGGYLQANWSIFKTKENLTKVCQNHNIKPIFFDGRGGPPARGGGKSHRFYAAQSDKIANNAIQLTIQGQTISSKYGTKNHFIHNSEQLLTAGLANSLYIKENTISEKFRVLIEQLAQISYEKYTDLKNHKMFVPYLENKSTLKYYGKTNIGSRPTKRGSDKELELKDLRAIPFVGSWSQLKQNVPGYFGIGSALKTLEDKGKLPELKKLFSDVPFFKALILNSMMSLNKCNFNLTNYIKKDPSYKEFWEILFNEYELSKSMVLKISGYKTLMEEEPISKSSIAIREDIVLPLLIIQQTALQNIENKSELKPKYEKIVMRSLFGNINASRNSA